jgi:TPR repeat protein
MMRRRHAPALFCAMLALLGAAVPGSALAGAAPLAPPPPGVDAERFGGGLTRDADVDPQRFGSRPPDQAYGAFQRGLYITAYNLALPRAEGGDPAAQTLLAEILSRGLGRPRNIAEAARWYALAAEQGIPEAQFQYALMLIDGTYVKKDAKEAYALMQAAAEANNELAQFNLAQMIVHDKPGEPGLQEARPYYQRAAEAGLADAQYAMSQIEARGTAGFGSNDAEARRWLELAARQNFDTAQLDLGLWMIEGRGGKRDAAEGFKWLLRAAQGGNVASQNQVAKLYMQGIGVEPDSLNAASWYMLARRAGLVDPIMEDFLDGLTDEEIKAAVEKSNRLR